MARETAQQLHAWLLNKRNEVGSTLYQRLVKALQLLGERDWVHDPSGGGGDEGTAIDRLESDCFGDVCGALSLPQMFEVLRAVPEEKTWKAHKYNLRAMWFEMQERRQTKAKPKQTKQQTEQDARDRVIAKLREENQLLRERVHTLEQQVKKQQKVIDQITKVQAMIEAQAS